MGIETIFLPVAGGIVLLFIVIFPSIRIIGPTEIGLVTKRFGFRKLSEGNPIAFRGEAGYQADLLMPGFRYKLWIVYNVKKFPWVQIPAGQIGVVIAQAGQPLPVGAKSAHYKKEFANFTDLRGFVKNGGQKGVQRPTLPPGSILPLHPVAFLVITKNKVYGLPIAPELEHAQRRSGLSPVAFGLKPEQLDVLRIEPRKSGGTDIIDMIGIVTTFEGDPLPTGDIASRLGGFADVEVLEGKGESDSRLMEMIFGNKNNLHNNYQDFQAFVDNGGKMGLQHDPVLYGAYNLNPFLVAVEIVPMLVVQQGEVAVIKSYVGLPSQDTSGSEFKFGSLVRPGHRGIWQEPLRTGKYPINPRCYDAEVVPTFILTLNWAAATSSAHKLDANLQSIEAKSREGFVFKIDLQVQIHVPDTKAPKVISIVGTMANLVNEVLQAAVGNHFRDKLQSLPAIKFIETRQYVQEEAFLHIQKHLSQYEIETKGVYIQDVVLPADMVRVLTEREIANQEIETFKRMKDAQDQRISMEHAKGTADMQTDLAKSKVGVDIKSNNAKARIAEAEGEATYISATGTARGAEVEAIGRARARAFSEQATALGKEHTAFVNAITSLAEKGLKFVPEIMVSGANSGAIDGLAGALMRFLSGQKSGVTKEEPGGK